MGAAESITPLWDWRYKHIKRYFTVLISTILIPLFLTGCGKQAEFALIYGDTMTDQTLTVSSSKTSLVDALADNGLPAAATALVYTGEYDIVSADVDDVSLSSDGTVEIGDATYQNVVGLMLDPPDATTRNAYSLTRGWLESEEQVLFIYLDGLGYDSWLEAHDRGITPNLSQLPVEQASGVYPTITPINYAAMVTGQTPSVSGIKQRSDHMLSCDSIFDYTLANGLVATIIEGDKQIISFAVDQQLHPDYDNSGDTDNEVFATAMQAVTDGGYDLVFVHFHGIDDSEHSCGPQTKQVFTKIAEIDQMVGQLLEAWDGRVVVVADHGQHLSAEDEDEDSGTHGVFRATDIFVPLMCR